MSRMQALRFFKDPNHLELVDIPVPKVAKSDDVLIKVAYSGLCESDLHIIQGNYPSVTSCITMGHEFCGTVIEIGTEVKKLKVGDKVAVDPNTGCGVCQYCRSGQLYYCRYGGAQSSLGIWKDGGWAEYALVSAHQVHKISKSANLEIAVLAEPISCVVHGWNILSPITYGSNILVMGAGITGRLWIIMLRLHGHQNVTVVDPSTTKLDNLKKLNTGYRLKTHEEMKEALKSNPKDLFNFIVDCSGSPRARDEILDLLHEGGKLCCFGEASPEAEIRIKIYDTDMKELKMHGTLSNPLTFTMAVRLLEIMGERYLSYERLGIKVFSLNDFENAIEMLKTGEITKAVFKI